MSFDDCLPGPALTPRFLANFSLRSLPCSAMTTYCDTSTSLQYCNSDYPKEEKRRRQQENRGLQRKQGIRFFSESDDPLLPVTVHHVLLFRRSGLYVLLLYNKYIWSATRVTFLESFHYGGSTSGRKGNQPFRPQVFKGVRIADFFGAHKFFYLDRRILVGNSTLSKEAT